ncbi:MAG: carbohydrate ABC transporter permease [Clostridiales bacterium]|nr:carbohydrate ABC transporter permease [Clostridiales bacterium]
MKQAQRKAIHDTRSDKMFNIVNTLILLAVFLVIAYPLYFVFIASVSDPLKVSSGLVTWRPVGFTLAGYEKILKFKRIWIGYRNTIFYAILGTIISVSLTVTLAYPLSRKDFKLRNPIMYMITFTMFFSGGMIPTYLVINEMGLLNTIWAVILPSAITAQHVIIVRTFYQGLPPELTEAAAIDGATNFKAYWYIVLPLSKAVVAVIALYVASSLWNTYFGPMIYLRDTNKYPLQLFLRQILLQNNMEGADIDASTIAEQGQVAELIKYGVIIVASVPMMILYPFIQKYFVKGVMIGSVKG